MTLCVISFLVYNGNFICPKKWAHLFVAKELMGRLGSNFHRKLLAISCISSYQTFCFKYIINENIQTDMPNFCFSNLT